jgi:hypothetical protein
MLGSSLLEQLASAKQTGHPKSQRCVTSITMVQAFALCPLQRPQSKGHPLSVGVMGSNGPTAFWLFLAQSL